MTIRAWRGSADGTVERLELSADEAESSELSAGPGGWIWVDVEAPFETAERHLATYGFHPLAVEDAVTLAHHPKLEEFPGVLFLIVRALAGAAAGRSVETGKLAVFLTGDRLVTYHRIPLPSVDDVASQLERGAATKGGPAWVLHQILDRLLDRYFPLLEGMREEIEELERQIFEEADESQLERTLELRRRLALVRRLMLPHRQIFNRLAFDQLPFVEEVLRPYFRDAYDSVFRLVDGIDQLRDQLMNVRSVYLSVVSQRTNEVMKVLTMFAAVLLPLSFIAGLYGMNFEHMPELDEPGAYYVVLGIMGAIAAAMLVFFRRRDWF